VVRHSLAELAALPPEVVPVVGCTPELRPLIGRWQAEDRRWVYWDRGYCRRVFATDLPVGQAGGYYRWHTGAFQMRAIRVVAEPSPTYQRFHGIEGWTRKIVARLRSLTDRPLVVRDKEMQRFGRRLHEDLRGAHCLVTHGSNAAVEAVVMGCPVFVDPSSAAALVGLTDLEKIDQPVYPDRQPWLHSLAYCQFSEDELVDGTLWRLMD
jgi:hypothetical protein